MKRRTSASMWLVTGLGLNLAAGAAAAEEARQVRFPENAAEEAADHRAMVKAAYKAEFHSKAPIRRAYEKRRKHSEPIIRDAERLAKNMDAFAAFYRLRAAELNVP